MYLKSYSWQALQTRFLGWLITVFAQRLLVKPPNYYWLKEPEYSTRILLICTYVLVTVFVCEFISHFQAAGMFSHISQCYQHRHPGLDMSSLMQVGSNYNNGKRTFTHRPTQPTVCTCTHCLMYVPTYYIQCSVYLTYPITCVPTARASPLLPKRVPINPSAVAERSERVVCVGGKVGHR